ncbi:MAG: outer membrane beta-barrel protein [Xanthobacteraceae bacterium]|jgi:outer membrane immunogenic protein
MKWLSRIGIALVAMAAAGSAGAADLAVRPAPAPYKAPPPVVVAAYSWSGFYVGVNAGGAWGKFDPITTTVFSPIGYFEDTGVPAVNAVGVQTINPSAFTGGVQAGFNWQAGSFVGGVEVDFNSFRLSGSATGTGVYPCCAPAGFTVTSAVSTDWLFTARGRLGFAANNWLFYVTGGLAVTNLKGDFSFTDNCGDVAICNGPGGPNAAEAASLSKTKLGYAVGGGVEAGLWSNWSLKAEYLYVRFSSESVAGLITTPALVFFSNNNPFTHTIDLRAHIARLGLNYRFGGPVVASY